MSFFFDQKLLPKIWLFLVVVGVVFFHFFPFVKSWSWPVITPIKPENSVVQAITLITPLADNKQEAVKTPALIKAPTPQQVKPKPLPITVVTTENQQPTEPPLPLASNAPQLVAEGPTQAPTTEELVKQQLLYEQELKLARQEKLAQMAKSVASEAKLGTETLISSFETVKIPQPKTLRYKVQAVNVVAPGGAATLTWSQPDPASYQLTFEATAAIIYTIRWASQGYLRELGLQPIHFSEKRFRSSETAAHFDYDNQQISFSKKEGKTAMMPGAQDRFSVVLQLASIIGADPDRFKAGQNIVIQVANSELAEAWVFNVVSIESLNVSGKSYETLKLQRQARKPYDAQLELWMAKELQYMPIRIKQTPLNGAGFDATWMGQ